jgi:hypothetical protein
MKKIVTFVILVVLFGILGGCADKEEGKAQFEKAQYFASKNAEKAEELFKESCSNDYAKGCASLAYHVSKQDDMNAAVKHIKKAIKIKLKEDRDDKKKYEGWKEFSSEVDQACKDKKSKDCTRIITSALWTF